ncbi:hypothetical protein KEM56_007197 [Ascosphaera pollenicola]|nr:hypothetical protein KEM56_007197 [Ascosphaera pollenicola]
MPEYYKREIEKRKPAPKPSKPAEPQSKTQRPRDEPATATKNRSRSSSVSSLNFDVLERDVPRQSAEKSNDADAQNDGGNEHHNDDDDDDERSLRLVSQEPVSSWEQSQTTQLPGNPVQKANDDGGDDDDMELEQQVPQGLGQENDDDDDDDESKLSNADEQSAKPREPSMELGGSGTATREKTPLPYTPSSQPSLPSQPSQKQPASPSVNEEEETRKIETWITSKCKEYALTDPAPVIEALLCTSVSLEHADQVVGYLVKGKGVPKNIRGVWTRKDDGDLQSGDKIAIERMVKKHGQKLVGLRQEYLSKRAQLNLHGQEMVNGL